MTNKERDRILEQYTHTVEGFESEEDLFDSEEVRAFEKAYADDAELNDLMRKARERKIKFLRTVAKQS